MEVYESDGIDVEGLRWWMGCFGTVQLGSLTLVSAGVWRAW